MWNLAGHECHSRLLVGTAQYPTLAILEQAIMASGTQVITVGLKHEDLNQSQGQSFWKRIQALNCKILPNTAGCMSHVEAIEVAKISQELFETNWVKLEVVSPQLHLQPNPFELVKAAETLNKLGFHVFPFCTDDLVLCKALYDSGCQIVMPWGSPIGSGKGLLNIFQLKALRQLLPKATLIIDAGIGSPQHALSAMQLGYDGVLINSAIAKALDPVMMARAFALAIESGRLSYQAGVMPESDYAIASTSLTQTLFGA
ncbi:thiazole synthase [Candidatus Berkiella aquae]|uniref:thiazole synthase n=1 Tax=Candidatus Berkiella aquae TaxID=295108 RepID=A0A0Q9YZM8_9GAMM|nr:thiazole synthase [Candidatus Berkiella aquae]MCS5712604.1 thiazole synthase [Candidatus Berkiella aquae]